jgi:hypothetical protein
MGKKLILGLTPLLFAVFSSCARPQNSPAEVSVMSPTVERLRCIERCFDSYYRAIYTDAETEIVERAADRVMEIIRYDFFGDWLTVMYDRYMHDDRGIEYLLNLIRSRAAEAGKTIEDVHEAIFGETTYIFNYLDETQIQILQRVHEAIELSAKPEE